MKSLWGYWSILGLSSRHLNCALKPRCGDFLGIAQLFIDVEPQNMKCVKCCIQCVAFGQGIRIFEETPSSSYDYSFRMGYPLGSFGLIRLKQSGPIKLLPRLFR